MLRISNLNLYLLIACTVLFICSNTYAGKQGEYCINNYDCEPQSLACTSKETVPNTHRICVSRKFDVTTDMQCGEVEPGIFYGCADGYKCILTANQDPSQNKWTCKPNGYALVAGQGPCGTDNNNCSTGLGCSTPQGNISNVKLCIGEWIDTGGNCSGITQGCSGNNTCLANICTKGLPQGAKCSSQEDCLQGLVCVGDDKIPGNGDKKICIGRYYDVTDGMPCGRLPNTDNFYACSDGHKCVSDSSYSKWTCRKTGRDKASDTGMLAGEGPCSTQDDCYQGLACSDDFSHKTGRKTCVGTIYSNIDGKNCSDPSTSCNHGVACIIENNNHICRQRKDTSSGCSFTGFFKGSCNNDMKNFFNDTANILKKTFNESVDIFTDITDCIETDCGGVGSAIVSTANKVGDFVVNTANSIADYFEGCVNSDKIKSPYYVKIDTSSSRTGLAVNPWLKALTMDELDENTKNIKKAAQYDIDKIVNYMKQMHAGIDKCRVDSWEEGANIIGNEISDLFTCKWGNMGDTIDCGYGYRQHITKCLSQCNMIKVLHTNEMGIEELKPLQECSLSGLATDQTNCGISSGTCDGDIMAKTFSVASLVSNAVMPGAGGLQGAAIKLAISATARNKSVKDFVSDVTGLPEEYVPIAAMAPFSMNLMAITPFNIQGTITETVKPEFMWNTFFNVSEESCKLGMKRHKVMSAKKASHTCKAVTQGTKLAIESTAAGFASAAKAAHTTSQAATNLAAEALKSFVTQALQQGINITSELVCKKYLGDSIGEKSANYTCGAIAGVANTLVAAGGNVIGGTAKADLEGADKLTENIDEVLSDALKEISTTLVVEGVKTGLTIAEAELCKSQTLSGNSQMFCSIALGLVTNRVDNAGNLLTGGGDEWEFVNTIDSEFKSGWQNTLSLLQENFENNFKVDNSKTEDIKNSYSKNLQNFLNNEYTNKARILVNDGSLNQTLYSDQAKQKCSNYKNDIYNILSMDSICRIHVLTIGLGLEKSLSEDIAKAATSSEMNDITMADLIGIGMTVDDAAVCTNQIKEGYGWGQLPIICQAGVKLVNNDNLFNPIFDTTLKLGIAHTGGLVQPVNEDNLTLSQARICGALMVPTLLSLYSKYNPKDYAYAKSIVSNKELCVEYHKLLNNAADNPGQYRKSLNDFLSVIAKISLSNPKFADFIQDSDYSTSILNSIPSYTKTIEYAHLVDITPKYLKWKNNFLTDEQALKYAQALIHAAYITLSKEIIQNKISTPESDKNFYEDPAFYDSQFDPTGVSAVTSAYNSKDCVTLRHIGNFLPEHDSVNNYHRILKQNLFDSYFKTGDLLTISNNNVVLNNTDGKEVISAGYGITCKVVGPKKLLECIVYNNITPNSCMKHVFNTPTFSVASPPESLSYNECSTRKPDLYTKNTSVISKVLFNHPTLERDKVPLNFVMQPGDFICSANKKFKLRFDNQGRLLHQTFGIEKPEVLFETNLTQAAYQSIGVNLDTTSTLVTNDPAKRKLNSPYSFSQDIKGACEDVENQGLIPLDLHTIIQTFDGCKYTCENTFNCYGISVALMPCAESNTCKEQCESTNTACLNKLIPKQDSNGVQTPSACRLHTEQIQKCTKWNRNNKDNIKFYTKKPYGDDLSNIIKLCLKGNPITNSKNELSNYGISIQSGCGNMIDNLGNLSNVSSNKAVGNYMYMSAQLDTTKSSSVELKLQNDGNFVLYQNNVAKSYAFSQARTIPTGEFTDCPTQNFNVNYNNKTSLYELYKDGDLLGTSKVWIGCTKESVLSVTSATANELACYRVNDNQIEEYFFGVRAKEVDDYDCVRDMWGQKRCQNTIYVKGGKWAKTELQASSENQKEIYYKLHPSTRIGLAPAVSNDKYLPTQEVCFGDGVIGYDNKDMTREPEINACKARCNLTAGCKGIVYNNITKGENCGLRKNYLTCSARKDKPGSSGWYQFEKYSKYDLLLTDNIESNIATGGEGNNGLNGNFKIVKNTETQKYVLFHKQNGAFTASAFNENAKTNLLPLEGDVVGCTVSDGSTDYGMGGNYNSLVVCFSWNNTNDNARIRTYSLKNGDFSHGYENYPAGKSKAQNYLTSFVFVKGASAIDSSEIEGIVVATGGEDGQGLNNNFKLVKNTTTGKITLYHNEKRKYISTPFNTGNNQTMDALSGDYIGCLLSDGSTEFIQGGNYKDVIVCFAWDKDNDKAKWRTYSQSGNMAHGYFDYPPGKQAVSNYISKFDLKLKDKLISEGGSNGQGLNNNFKIMLEAYTGKYTLYHKQDGTFTATPFNAGLNRNQIPISGDYVGCLISDGTTDFGQGGDYNNLVVCFAWDKDSEKAKWRTYALTNGNLTHGYEDYPPGKTEVKKYINQFKLSLPNKTIAIGGESGQGLNDNFKIMQNIYNSKYVLYHKQDGTFTATPFNAGLNRNQIAISGDFVGCLISDGSTDFGQGGDYSNLVVCFAWDKDSEKAKWRTYALNNGNLAHGYEDYPPGKTEANKYISQFKLRLPNTTIATGGEPGQGLNNNFKIMQDAYNSKYILYHKQDGTFTATPFNAGLNRNQIAISGDFVGCLISDGSTDFGQGGDYSNLVVCFAWDKDSEKAKWRTYALNNGNLAHGYEDYSLGKTGASKFLDLFVFKYGDPSINQTSSLTSSNTDSTGTGSTSDSTNPDDSNNNATSTKIQIKDNIDSYTLASLVCYGDGLEILVKNSTVDECKKLCDNNELCKGFVINENDGGCQLRRTAIANCKANKGNKGVLGWYQYDRNNNTNTTTSDSVTQTAADTKINIPDQLSGYIIDQQVCYGDGLEVLVKNSTVDGCKDLCDNNELCKGFVINENDGGCQLRRTAIANCKASKGNKGVSGWYQYDRNNATSTTSSDTVTETAADTKINIPDQLSGYIIDQQVCYGDGLEVLVKNSTVDECKNLCNNNELCKGFVINENDGGCQLRRTAITDCKAKKGNKGVSGWYQYDRDTISPTSETKTETKVTIPEKLEGYTLTTQVCNGDELENIISNSSVDSCKNLCSNNNNCMGFVINENDGSCQLRKTSIKNCTADKQDKSLSGWYQYDLNLPDPKLVQDIYYDLALSYANVPDYSPGDLDLRKSERSCTQVNSNEIWCQEKNIKRFDNLMYNLLKCDTTPDSKCSELYSKLKYFKRINSIIPVDCHYAPKVFKTPLSDENTSDTTDYNVNCSCDSRLDLVFGYGGWIKSPVAITHADATTYISKISLIGQGFAGIKVIDEESCTIEIYGKRMNNYFKIPLKVPPLSSGNPIVYTGQMTTGTFDSAQVPNDKIPKSEFENIQDKLDYRISN